MTLTQISIEIRSFRSDGTDTVDVVADLPVVAGVVCQECEYMAESGSGEPLYECGSCGEVFNRGQTEGGDHRCPSCNKFGSKIAPDSCADCETGELEPIAYVVCPRCEEGVEATEFAQHFAEDCNG